MGRHDDAISSFDDDKLIISFRVKSPAKITHLDVVLLGGKDEALAI